MNASKVYHRPDQQRYRQFLFSLDWLAYGTPYLAVLGCGSAMLGQQIQAELQRRVPTVQCFERWECSDDFAKAFTAAPGSTLLLDFRGQEKQLTDTQIAEQLLFYRDKAIGYRLHLVCLTTVPQFDAIHQEAFDFVAAASFVHAFGESKQALPAHQHLTTAKTTTINE